MKEKSRKKVTGQEAHGEIVPLWLLHAYKNAITFAVSREGWLYARIHSAMIWIVTVLLTQEQRSQGGVGHRRKT